MHRLSLLVVVLALTATACSSSGLDVSEVPELPLTTPDDVSVLLAESDKPVVLNVWASWCIPCRSEAPLLRRAADTFGDQVRIIGLNVRDTQPDAREFIAEFFADSDIEHLFDRSGEVPGSLGGSRGVPLTFFFEQGGDLVELHFGVIDERTLALQIDELLARMDS